VQAGTDRVWEFDGKSMRIWAPTHHWVKPNALPLLSYGGEPLGTTCLLVL